MHTKILMHSIFFRLTRYKTRSFFMMLGIIVSVTAIVLVQAVGTSLENKFTNYISAVYPADTVYLAGGNGFMGGGYGARNLKLHNVRTINNSVNGIVAYAPVVYAGRNNIINGSHSARVSVVGVSDVSEEATNRPVVDGTFFTKTHLRRKAKVAVIGSSAAQLLFPGGSPVGQSVFFNNVKFDIIGLLETVGVDPHGNDRDNDLHLPYTTLMDRMLKRDYLSGVTFILEEYDADSVAGIIDEISTVMRDQHNIRNNEDDDFSIIAPKHMLGMVDEVFNKFDIVVPVLTFIVFGISGMVIFNSMLITIKERTAEIGLRKALGAQPSDIRLHLILETSVLCVMGTLLGLILSAVILQWLSPLFAIKFGVEAMAIQSQDMLMAFLASATASLLSTILPAHWAAKMNPVSALS